MRKNDLNRVVFYSKEDMAGGMQIRKGEAILKAETKSEYSDINEILELYNIKKYIDNGLFLTDWTSDDISDFKLKVAEYNNVIGTFISKINESNVKDIYHEIIREYINSFWELVNNQKCIQKNFQTHILSDPLQ